MNIVFALIPEKGHINPYIGPAQVLSARGHQVTVLAPGDISAQMASAGLPFGLDLVPPTPPARPTHGAELVELIQDPPRLAAWIEELLLSGIPQQVEAIRRACRRLSAQVVVIDPLYYAAAIAAHLEGLPWASVSNSLNPVLPPELDSDLLRTTRALHPRRQAIFGGYGMTPEFRGCDVLSPFLTIAFTTEALCGPVAGVRLAGPSFPIHRRGDEVPLQPLPADKPIVYASFGSQIYHWPELFAKLQLAAGIAGVHLVLAAGELHARFQAYRYAPQREILQQARLFITHGGANSFMESIAAGVPMLLSPMCNDQFHQAYFLERTGIGRTTDLRIATPEAIAAAIALLTADGPHRDAAGRLARTYQGNGAERAAEWIEQL
jgi:UDP:flavonoid glycosyltransferase YjiC (YdhE family)